MIRRLRAALIVLVAVTAGLVVVTAGPAAAETEVICPNSPIPVGWIHSDSFSVFSVCGSPGPVPPWIVTQWEITRISDRFRDDLVNMCIDTGIAIPAGWAEIASSAVPGRCGYTLPQPGAAPNVRLIKCLNCPLRPPEPPTPTPTRGGLDAIATTGAVLGWAQDTGRAGESIRVDYYVDGPAGVGVPAGNAIADAVRLDVSPGNHGLRFTLPAQFFDGRLHTLYAYGIDATNDPNVLLTGAPRLFILPKRPIGFLEQIDAAGVATGWTLDPSLLGYGNPNTVDLYIDGFFVARVPANVPRSDIVGGYGYPGDHGFRWPIPPDWRDGQPHTLSIRANDLTGDDPRDLPGSPKQFTLTRRKATVDFDGDFRTDIAIFRPGAGQWWYLPTASPPGSSTVTFGQSEDIPVPADYDGDGRTDVAVYRNGAWLVLQSNTQNVLSVAFGQPGDKPVPSDYNGDGYADIAVFRPSDGTWYIRLTGGDGGYYGVPYGVSTDRPVPGDYDADGIADLAVYRPLVGAWIVHQSSNGQDVYTQFGLASDREVPADYDGDGHTDRAVFRPATGTWHILQSIDGRYVQVQYGVQGDQVAPGDYDGDGKADQAVFRPSTGIWYVHQSRDGDLARGFGAPGDVVVTP